MDYINVEFEKESWEESQPVKSQQPNSKVMPSRNQASKRKRKSKNEEPYII